MATNKRVFTLRLSDEVFDKIGILATDEHRSMTNYIEYVLIQHLEQIEKNTGKSRQTRYHNNIKITRLLECSLVILVVKNRQPHP